MGLFVEVLCIPIAVVLFGWVFLRPFFMRASDVAAPAQNGAKEP